MSPLLTAQAVHDLALACALQPDEVAPIVEVEGVRRRFGFVRARVFERRAAIDALLAQLPHAFRAIGYGPDAGGGWTFLNACYTHDERPWGEPPDVELLLALGLTIGSVEWLLERELWPQLPGQLPYFHIRKPEEGRSCSICATCGKPSIYEGDVPPGFCPGGGFCLAFIASLKKNE